MKKTVIVLLLLFICYPVFSQQMRLRVGILDFAGRGVSESDASAVGDWFTSRLVDVNYYDIVDRKNIDSIFKEQNLQMSGCLDSSCAVEIGQILALDKMIYGNINRLGSHYIINVYMIDVNTAQIEQSAGVRIDEIEKSYEIMDDLISNFVGLEVEAEDEPNEIPSFGSSFAFELSTGVIDVLNRYMSVNLGLKYMITESIGISAAFPFLFIVIDETDPVVLGYNFTINAVFQVGDVLGFTVGAETWFNDPNLEFDFQVMPGAGVYLGDFFLMLYLFPGAESLSTGVNFGFSFPLK